MASPTTYSAEEINLIFEILGVPEMPVLYQLDNEFGATGTRSVQAVTVAGAQVAAIINSADHTTDMEARVKEAVAQYKTIRFDAISMNQGGAGSAKGVSFTSHEQRERVAHIVRTYIPIYAPKVARGGHSLARA